MSSTECETGKHRPTHAVCGCAAERVAAVRLHRELAEKNVEFLRKELAKLRADICEHAEDTAWCGPAETVCERITTILGDEWEAQ